MEGRVDVRLSILLTVDRALQVVENLLGLHLLKLLGCKDMTRFIGAVKDEGHELDMWLGRILLHGFLSFWLLLLIMIIQMMMMRLARSSFD